METLDPIFTSAISSGQIPGAVLAAASLDGTFNYLKAFGRTSCDPESSALATDATFWLASATKLFTAVAAMQCVDRGLVSLDEDVSRVLPELKKPQILKGWDENGKPVLEEAKTEISLRFVHSVSWAIIFGFCSISSESRHRLAEIEKQDVVEPHKWTRVRDYHCGVTEISLLYGRGIRIPRAVPELSERTPGKFLDKSSASLRAFDGW